MRHLMLLAAALAIAAAPSLAQADMIQTKVTLKDKEVRALMKVPAGVTQRVVIENTGPGGLVLPLGGVSIKAGESVLTTYKSDGPEPFSLQGSSGPNQITQVNLYYLF